MRWSMQKRRFIRRSYNSVPVSGSRKGPLVYPFKWLPTTKATWQIIPMDCGNEISFHESHENYTTGKRGCVMSRQEMDKIIKNSLEYRLWSDNQYPITAINKFTTAIHSIIALYLQIFSCKKFCPFQNLSLGFNLKIFLIFCKFQPRYSHKI